MLDMSCTYLPDRCALWRCGTSTFDMANLITIVAAFFLKTTGTWPVSCFYKSIAYFTGCCQN